MKKINLIIFVLMLTLVLSNLVLAHTGEGYYGNHMMDVWVGGYGWMLFGWLFGVLFLVALVLLIVWLIKQIQRI